MSTQSDHCVTEEPTGAHANSVVTMRVPARAAAYLEAYVEESVSPGAIKVQRVVLWLFVAFPLGFVVFGVRQLIAAPGDDGMPVDVLFMAVGTVMAIGMLVVRAYTLRFWKRAGLV